MDKLEFERQARSLGYRQIAGVDEAGRGPLAGPVVAAACILPEPFDISGIDDSKKLSPHVRKELFDKLIPSVSYGIGIIDAETIDRVNIYQATILAMLQAIENLSQKPDYILVDGMKLTRCQIPCEKIIKGDQKSLSIGAASILAKETRDRLMLEIHQRYPQYGFDRHKGYGTPQHLQALKEYGPCPLHRLTFEPIKTQVSVPV